MTDAKTSLNSNVMVIHDFKVIFLFSTDELLAQVDDSELSKFTCDVL